MNVMVTSTLSLMVLLALITAVLVDYTGVLVVNNSSRSIEIHVDNMVFKVGIREELELKIPRNESALKIIINNRSYVLPINRGVARLYLLLGSKDKIFYALLTSSNMDIVEDIKYELVRYSAGSGIILSITLAGESSASTKIINATYCTTTKCIDVNTISLSEVKENNIIVTVNVERGKLPFIDVVNNSVSLLLNIGKSNYLMLLYSRSLGESTNTSTTSTTTTPSIEHTSTRLFTFIATNTQGSGHEADSLGSLVGLLVVGGITLENILLLIAAFILGVSIYLNIKLRRSER